MNDPDLRQRLGQAAEKRAKEEFTKETFLGTCHISTKKFWKNNEFYFMEEFNGDENINSIQ